MQNSDKRLKNVDEIKTDKRKIITRRIKTNDK